MNNNKTSLFLLQIALISGFCALTCCALFMNGVPMGYDYPHQILAYEAVREQILGGELYPRWLSDVNRGMGGTNLFFYAPLIYYTGFAIDWLSGFHLTTIQILQANFTLLSVLGGIAFYIFATKYVSAWRAMFFACLYSVLPYHLLFEVYARTATSEFSAYIWIPLIFYFLDHDIHKSRTKTCGFIISYAALILSHLTSAVIATIFIGLYTLLQNVKIEDRATQYKFTFHTALCGLLGVGLSAFFLYPALTMLDYTNSAVLWQGEFDYKEWFLNPLTYKSCPVDHACLFLFMIAFLQIMIPVTVLLMGYSALTTKRKKQAIILFSLCGLCFFLMTNYSFGIWYIIPTLQKIQFPWRLLLFSDFLLVFFLMIAIGEKEFKKNAAIIAGLYLFFTLIMMQYLIKTEYKDEDHSLRDRIAANVLTPEHIPSGIDMRFESIKELETAPELPQWTLVKGNADLHIIDKKPRHIEMQINAGEASTIQYKQFQFIGWRVMINGEDKTTDVNLRSAPPFGQIEMDIPQGEYALSLSMPMLREEKTGWIISVLALLTSILFALFLPLRSRQNA